MKRTGKVRRISIFLYAIFAISVILYIISSYSEALAGFLVSTVGFAIRRTLGLITGVFPFSLFELFILTSPVILVFVVISAIRALHREGGAVRYTTSILAIISLLSSMFIYTLGLPYKTERISDRMSLDISDEYVSENLIRVAYLVRDSVNEYAEKIKTDDGATEMPYNMRELSRRLSEGYSALSEDYPYVEGHRGYVKPVIFSSFLSRVGLTGIYTYPSGESNVNVEYPDYCVAFTSAHEMAHARGISREDEASFVAFLVSIYSDDDYIRYSGYLNLYEYLASAVRRVDPDEYKRLAGGLSDVARADIRASYEVYKKYEGSRLGEIGDKLNDSYLKANGEDGTVSYSYVTKLVVAYLSGEK